MPEGKHASRPKRLAGLGTAVALAAAFLVLSFSHTLSSFLVGFGGHKVLESVIAEPIWGTVLGRDLAYFILVQTLLHALFALALFALACLTQYAWPGLERSRPKLVACWFILGALWVLVANAGHYPHSAVAAPFVGLAHAEIMGLSGLTVVNTVCTTLVATVMAAALRKKLRTRPMPRMAYVAGALALVTVAGIALPALADRPVPPAGSTRPDITRTDITQPNIILIGVDSLRPDVVTSADASRIVPAISGFTKQAVVFSDVMTPLARTFPSWVSILTGRHPHTTGAVVNLVSRDHVRTGRTLPDLLREAGYRTVYAIDEVRFANIDGSYGFDKVIAPPMGATDFMLGIINDAPLSNLLINTPVGRVLFPHAHANRAAAVTYDPDTFIDSIERELPPERPLFLAVHFTLPHWPFIWADAPLPPDGDSPSPPELYEATVRRVDQQVAALQSLLSEKGLLDHAIVVLLSDHGEALGEPGDSLLPAEHAEQFEDIHVTIWGHGTSVLSPYQYRTVLAIRSFGGAGGAHFQKPRSIGAPVSLEDLTPTLLDLMEIETHEHYDGRSLLPLVRAEQGAHEAFADRVRFTETEFNPPAMVAGQPVPTASELERTARHYEMDPATGRLSVRKHRLTDILRERQFAAIQGEALLAALPVDDGARYKYVFFEGRGALPTRLASSPDPALHPTAALLWERLHGRFPALAEAGIADTSPRAPRQSRSRDSN